MADSPKAPVGGCIFAADPITFNESRPSVTLKVRNTGDRPIQVGSHFHFFEVNRALEFDRAAAYGMRLNIPSTTAIRFEPAVATAPESTTQQATEPATAKPTEASTEPQAKTCTININCSTILNNMDKLKEEKKGIVPANGVILSGCEIEVQEGDSVYDVLVRACQQNKIHMDADYTPAYGSAYIKGIANLYERDCGSLSGWTYRVNGVFPSVGCSSYDANEGDVIEFLYTCDLGADVGNGFNG